MKNPPATNDADLSLVPFAGFHPAPGHPAFVVAQLGQSLDGRIATPTGDSRYISGPAALDHLHALRAHVDAVIVGIGTVIADDPQLNVRRVPGKNPARVVIDPRGRLPEVPRCFSLDDGAPCYLIREIPGPVPPGVTEILLPPIDGRIPPAEIVAALAKRGMTRLLIEGGAATISAFIDAGQIDRLHLLLSTVIIGSGPQGLNLKPITFLREARRPVTNVYNLGGGDMVFDCDLRRSQEDEAAGAV